MKYAVKLNSTVLLAVLMTTQTGFAGAFCDTAAPNPTYVKVQADVEKRIAEFSNKKIIAIQADALLSKLISAKSPVLISWMNKRNLATAPEDKIVHEWRDYFARNFILSRYPSDDAKINAEVEKLVDTTLSAWVDKAFKEKMEVLFQKSKKAALATVAAFDISTKDEISKRMQAVKLYWPAGLKTARNNAIPLDIIDWGIAYDPGANEINMGLKALAYPSDETYLAVFAHELGHSFDSCRWGAFFTGEWPFKKVGECLRSNESVAAKKRDDGPLESYVKAGKISAEIATGLKLNPTCNRLVYPPPGVQADQLPEGFADWFSAEVLARVDGLNVLKVRQDLCGPKSLIDGTSYSSNENRLNRIYFANPILKSKRADAGELTAKYCSLK